MSQNPLVEPSEVNKPTSTQLEISNEDLSDKTRQAKLDNARIQLFKWAIFASITIISFLVIALLTTVGVYLKLIYQGKSIPDNF